MQRRAFLQSVTAAAAAATLPLDALTAATLPARGSRSRADMVRLNSNENPLGIPDSSRVAIMERGFQLGNRYPGELMDELRARIAGREGIGADSVVLGNGSTEVLQMAVQAHADPGARLVIPDPTYEDVPDYARPYEHLELVRVPLRADHSHDLERMEAATRGAAGPVMVYICNPNNPTGSLTSSDAVDAWIRRAPDHVVFLVDEAYIDFVDDPSYHTALPWIESKRNVIVARTFSKIYGLAGLRVGYAMGHPETIADVDRYRAFVNINQLGLVAALAAYDDRDYIRESLRVNDEAKRIMVDALDELGLDYIPTHTNFIFHRIGGDLDRYIDRMADEGFRVGRKFPPMLSYNRLSFGLPEDMRRFTQTLRDFRSNGWV